MSQLSKNDFAARVNARISKIMADRRKAAEIEHYTSQTSNDEWSQRFSNRLGEAKLEYDEAMDQERERLRQNASNERAAELQRAIDAAQRELDNLS